LIFGLGETQTLPVAFAATGIVFCARIAGACRFAPTTRPARSSLARSRAWMCKSQSNDTSQRVLLRSFRTRLSYALLKRLNDLRDAVIIKFQKRRQLFICAHNEPLSVAMRVNDPVVPPSESRATFRVTSGRILRTISVNGQQ